MAKIGRHRAARLVLPLCGLLTAGALSFAVPVAAADPLEGLPGAVGEVTESVEEVANGVIPPTQEVVETAVPPVGEVTETVAPPVKEVVETATQAAGEVAAKAPPPAVTTPPKLPVVSAVVQSASAIGSRPTEASRSATTATSRATHDAKETLGAAAGATRSGRPSAGEGSPAPSAAADGGPTSDVPVTPKAADPGANADAPGADPRIRGDDKFAAPSTDGSIRAPVPKWIAYVWPAIALLGPELADLLRRWEQVGAQLLGASGGEPSGSQGVAGAHASHDARIGASASPSSPFPDIPAAVGGFTSHVPGEALAYLAVVALLVAAVFGAVKFELSHRGRGSS